MVKSVPQFIWNLFKYHEKALIFKPWGPCKTNIPGFYGLGTGYLKDFSPITSNKNLDKVNLQLITWDSEGECKNHSL